MPQATKALDVLVQIKVNDEGSAEGWTPSLPVGTVDNDLFEPVTDPSPTILSITRAASVATVTTDGDHHLPSNTEVTITGAVETEYNGTVVITKTGADTFEYTVPGAPTSPATGSPVMVASGDFIRVKGSTGYLRPRNYNIQVRWDKVGQPVSAQTHVLDIGDTGVTDVRTTDRLFVVGSTLPAIGATDDFEVRFNFWVNSLFGGTVIQLLRTSVGQPQSIYYTDSVFIYEQGAGQVVGSPPGIVPASWNELKVIGTDPGGGYELQFYINDVLVLTSATAFLWDVTLDWRVFDGNNEALFVASNFYASVLGIIYVNEELKTGPGVMSTTGSPVFNTRRDNA